MCQFNALLRACCKQTNNKSKKCGEREREKMRVSCEFFFPFILLLFRLIVVTT
jgi:hypothetical protein